jgi:hypothetical protein
VPVARFLEQRQLADTPKNRAYINNRVSRVNGVFFYLDLPEERKLLESRPGMDGYRLSDHVQVEVRERTGHARPKAPQTMRERSQTITIKRGARRVLELEKQLGDAEFNVLLALAERRGHVATFADLCQAAGFGPAERSRLTSAVQKIRRAFSGRGLIESKYGVGYRLSDTVHLEIE